MKAKSQSYNTSLNLALKKFWLPSGARLLLVFLTSILLLALLNTKALWNFFTQGDISAQSLDVGDIINQKAQAVHKFFDSISAGRTLVIVFWLFIGCVVYLLVWFVSNLINSIRNDIVADEYVHPAAYNRKGYWHTIIARKLFFACNLAVLMGFLAVGIKVVILLAKLCYSALADFHFWHSLWQIAVSVLAVTLLLQIFSMLAKITLSTWEFIYKDL